MNSWKRRFLAMLSVPLLALPSAYGVYLWLEPHIGEVMAALSASGYEAMYIGINLLIIANPKLRRYARNVALTGVVTAIVFNTLARYQAMVCPAPSEGAQTVVCTIRDVTFDAAAGTAFALAMLESIPLASLAYAMSVLLHYVSEDGNKIQKQRARLVKRLWELRGKARLATYFEALLRQAEERVRLLQRDYALLQATHEGAVTGWENERNLLLLQLDQAKTALNAALLEASNSVTVTEASNSEVHVSGSGGYTDQITALLSINPELTNQELYEQTGIPMASLKTIATRVRNRMRANGHVLN